jgi:choice-of-anchor C domain-containing protein
MGNRLKTLRPALVLTAMLTATGGMVSGHVAAADAPSIGVNGDFENPVVSGLWTAVYPPGFDSWTVDSGSVDIVHLLWTAPSGVQSIDLDGNCCGTGSVSQSLSTSPGSKYVLSFWFAGNPDPNPICGPPGVKRMEAFWGGTSLGVFSFDTTEHSLEDPGWERISLPVTATGRATTLRFASLTPGACGPAIDGVAVVPSVTTVSIDIKPGSVKNPIHLSARGLIPVAILSTTSFDASSVDPNSVCFGDSQDVSQRDCDEAHRRGHHEDVNADGRLDLLLHFNVSETGIDPGDRTACLSATTFGGVAVEGCDTIKVV